MFGRQPVVNIDFLLQYLSPELSDNFDEFSRHVSDQMREAFAIVRNSLRCTFDRAKKRYDHRVKMQLLQKDSLFGIIVQDVKLV